MTKEKIDKFLELLDEIVNEPGLTWDQRKQQIINQADDSDKTNLSEFSAWFDS